MLVTTSIASLVGLPEHLLVPPTKTPKWSRLEALAGMSTRSQILKSSSSGERYIPASTAHLHHSNRTGVQCLYSQLLIYGIAIVLPKLAILLFYLRIFPSPNFRLSVYILAILVISWTIGVEFSTIFQCSPISYAWTRKPPGRCINLLAFYRWVSLPNILFDIIMLLLPVHRIWKLQVTSKQKMALSGVFLTGGL